MPPLSVPVDKHGFPIPRRLSDDTPPKAPRERRPLPSWVRVVAGMLLVGGVAVLAALPAWRRGGGAGLTQLRLEQAHQKFRNGDLPGALKLADKAHQAAPHDPLVAIYRGLFRMEAGNLAGSLHDLNRAQQLVPRERQIYSLRSRVYQRLGRHQEAIADATENLALAREHESEPYNERAYVRAVAGVELEDALDDVQRAIELEVQANAAYLDTRGYIYHRLGKQEEALADLDQAITLAEAEGPWGLTPRELRRAGASNVELRRYEEQLSVLYYHRGLVHQALGHEELAQRDLNRGQDLGYDPAAGVF
jgi:tetratricopeptide (TPR) repeat protein